VRYFLSHVAQVLTQRFQANRDEMRAIQQGRDDLLEKIENLQVRVLTGVLMSIATS
jgi:hypothetical protein